MNILSEKSVSFLKIMNYDFSLKLIPIIFWTLYEDKQNKDHRESASFGKFWNIRLA